MEYIENKEEELEYTKNKKKAERRKNDWHHALRKKHRSAYYCQDQAWYQNLHQYSKGKIHCSCPMCASKTRGKIVKKMCGPGENWSERDRRRMDSMEESVREYQEISTGIPETVQIIHEGSDATWKNT